MILSQLAEQRANRHAAERTRAVRAMLALRPPDLTVRRVVALHAIMQVRPLHLGCLCWSYYLSFCL